jgi:hypothetical protein
MQLQPIQTVNQGFWNRNRQQILISREEHPKPCLFVILFTLIIISEDLKKLLTGRDSSFDIATGYGVKGPGIESQWGRGFSQTSRPTLEPTQPPVQWVLGLSRW